MGKAICKISGHRHGKSFTYNMLVKLSLCLLLLHALEKWLDNRKCKDYKFSDIGDFPTVVLNSYGLIKEAFLQGGVLAGGTGTRFLRRRCIKCIQRWTKNPDLWRDQPPTNPGNQQDDGGGGEEK